MGKTLLDDLASGKTADKLSSFDEISLDGKQIFFSDDSKSYAVIFSSSAFVQLIELGTTVINISTVRREFLKKNYEQGKIAVSELERIMIDESILPEKIIREHRQAVQIADEMVIKFNGRFDELKLSEGRSFVNEQIEKYGCSRTRIWKIYRRYLQSSFDSNALYDRRISPKKSGPYKYEKKPGRKSNSRDSARC